MESLAKTSIKKKQHKYKSKYLILPSQMIVQSLPKVGDHNKEKLLIDFQREIYIHLTLSK